MAYKPVFVLVLFFLSSVFLFLLTKIAPEINSRSDVILKFPSNLEELRALCALLRLYYEHNSLYVIILFGSSYLYKQSFMIPGSILLNILAGALFGVTFGLPLCVFLTGSGATISYLLSKYFGEDLIRSMWPEKVSYFNQKVEENSYRLIYYLFFLRLFPATPNWLLNVISPIIGIPLNLFFFSACIGLIPYIYICVQAGAVLSSISTINDIFTMSIVLKMSMMALVSLIPGYLVKKKKNKTELQ